MAGLSPTQPARPAEGLPRIRTMAFLSSAVYALHELSYIDEPSQDS